MYKKYLTTNRHIVIKVTIKSQMFQNASFPTTYNLQLYSPHKQHKTA